MNGYVNYILNHINCSGTYCQEYESSNQDLEMEKYRNWSLYVKQYELFSAMILYHEKMNKDVSEIITDKDSIELVCNGKRFIQLDMIRRKNSTYIYSILVPSDDSMENYQEIEKMEKTYNKDKDAYFVGTFDIYKHN